jgi:hypothetical protein
MCSVDFAPKTFPGSAPTAFGAPVGLRHRRVAAFISMATAEHKASVWSELCDFYDDGSSYGTLSQRIHGLQAAKQAAMAGAPKEVIVGALLHDIGWKLAREVSAAS